MARGILAWHSGNLPIAFQKANGICQKCGKVKQITKPIKREELSNEKN
jgi:hypothetical protein